MKIWKILGKAINVALILFVIWGVASYVDVISHNLPHQSDYLQYASWNLFELLF